MVNSGKILYFDSPAVQLILHLTSAPKRQKQGLSMKLCHLAHSIIFVLFCSFTSADDQDVKQKQWSNTSKSGTYSVTIYPKQTNYTIGDYHDWFIEVRDTADKPLTDLRIGVTGGMVAHGHGLPTQPVVSSHINNGKYRIEGMLFNMSGNWTLIFHFRNAGFNDQAIFDIELEHS